MVHKIKDLFDLDDHILKIIQFGLKISILICAISIVVLLIYRTFYISHDLYEGGIILFRTGLLFAVQFLICGIAINKISRDMKRITTRYKLVV